MARNKVAARQTKYMAKKGKLKGKNKKETKLLRGACVHHYYNKKGNLKPLFFKQDDYMICNMCKAKVPLKFFSNEKIDKTVENMTLLNNHNKYTATAIGAGDKTVEYFSKMGADLTLYAKMSKKVRNIGKKAGTVKKKKKNKKRSGSQIYGSWETR